MVSIKITGINTTRAFLSSMSTKIQSKADSAIKESGFFIEGETKQSIAGNRAEHKSVDTGRFLNSVKNAHPQPLTAVVDSNVSYAKFLEYGTSRFEGRRHFGNTAKRNENKVKDFVMKKIKEAV